jgi:formylglycine-generating enzyme required for sulfatase activity
MTRFSVYIALAAAIAGCGSDEGNGAKPSTKDSAADPAAAIDYEKPVAFESLPLAGDTTYESMPVGEGSQPGEVREFTKLRIRFCWCPPGTFKMGSDAPGHLLNERSFEARHSRGFWMQQTELTQEQYEQLMGVNPSHFRGTQNPVDSVTWTEATEFCRRLSALPPEKKHGNLFRLPTEAEWEYACRAGSTTAFCFGDDESGLGEYGWYHKNSAQTTHPVGGKQANAWGLHDMHGNVMEWCRDFYADYPAESATDPQGPDTGDKRVLRGGSWFQVPLWARSSHREAYTPATRYVGLGFRIVATEMADGSQ